LQTSRKPNAGRDAQAARTSTLVAGEAAKRAEPSKPIRTVLVPSCGWPTEASVPRKHKRVAGG